MSTYLYIILAYLIVLTGFNFYRARRVKSQEDFMVAGRKLKTSVMVFTLICTWIGSGTFIAGAEFASKAGFSALWLAAGAWVGIIKTRGQKGQQTLASFSGLQAKRSVLFMNMPQLFEHVL